MGRAGPDRRDATPVCRKHHAGRPIVETVSGLGLWNIFLWQLDVLFCFSVSHSVPNLFSHFSDGPTDAGTDARTDGRSYTRSDEHPNARSDTCSDELPYARSDGF